jgi:DNA processing protein
MTERAALVYLLRNGKRWRHLTDLVALTHSALAVLRREFSDIYPEDDALKAVEMEIQRWERSGCRLVTILDDDFPLNLRGVHDRPPFLFVKGQLYSKTDRKAVAVVGTRQASEDGLRRAARLGGGWQNGGWSW